MVFASLWLNQVTENWRPNGDGIMIWSSSCQSLWPASLWSTVITAECRKHSRESDESWVTRIPLRHKNTFFFFPRQCSTEKSSQIDGSLPSQISETRTALYNGNFYFGLICIPVEQRAEKLLFLMCQWANSGLWGVHNRGSDNLRSFAFVSMVTGRDGEVFIGVCACGLVCRCVWGSSLQTVTTHRRMH